MRHQYVEAFDPVGHAAAGEVGAERFDRVPLGEVALVGAQVGGGEFRELQATNQELKREVADYQRKVVEQDDPAYIEAQARKRLQMVKRGERQVVVIAPDREEQEAAERAEAERRANPWYENIWDAVSTPPEGK